jgi:putative NADPH-quinone reductase
LNELKHRLRTHPVGKIPGGLFLGYHQDGHVLVGRQEDAFREIVAFIKKAEKPASEPAQRHRKCEPDKNFMARRILIIDGHPDPNRERFGHALATAYAEGAKNAGHDVRRINISEIEIPFLRTREEWADEKPPPAIAKAQSDILWAEHLVLIFPLWAGTMPALLKAFFEQAFRPGIAVEKELGKMWPGLLRGKSARVVVTMGMPAWFYRYFYLAHGLKGMERNILRFSGIRSIGETLIGGVESSDESARKKWLAKMRLLGTKGQ